MSPLGHATSRISTSCIKGQYPPAADSNSDLRAGDKFTTGGAAVLADKAVRE
jgi:hypothetical protein